MKIKYKLISVLAAFFILCSGCCSEIPGKTKSAQEVIDIPAVATKEYTSRALFIKKSDNTLVAILENGKIIPLQESDIDEYIYSGCTSEELVVSIDEGQEVAKASYPYCMGRQIPVTSNYDNAPETYARSLLDNLIYNGTPAAISEYQLNDVKVKDRKDKGRIDVAMNFDVKPCRNSYQYENPSADGFVRGIYREFSIYGTDNIWLADTSSSEIIGNAANEKKLTSDFMILSENQELLYVSKNFSYYSEKKYIPHKNEDKENGVSVEYDTSIWSFDHMTGTKIKILEGKRNTDFRFADFVDNKLYLSSFCWLPYSESFPGELGYIYENTQQYGRLLESSRIVATAENTAYAIDEKSIYAVDLESAAVDLIGSLPEQVSEGNPVSVCNIINGVMKIVYYGDRAPVCYEIDLN